MPIDELRSVENDMLGSRSLASLFGFNKVSEQLIVSFIIVLPKKKKNTLLIAWTLHGLVDCLKCFFHTRCGEALFLIAAQMLCTVMLVLASRGNNNV